MKGLASHCKAKTTFTFYFSILTLLSTLKKAFDREMKSESGFSFAMASQPFGRKSVLIAQKYSLVLKVFSFMPNHSLQGYEF